jgi:hypothetical protein
MDREIEKDGQRIAGCSYGDATVSKKLQIFAVATALAVLAGQLIWAADDRSPAPTATSRSAGNASDKSEALQEVTVTANHFELEKKVSKFVYRIATLQNGEGLARWRIPVCSIVAGVSQQDGDFTAKRISEIARAAGVPLAEEPCRPNLFVFVTPDAKQFFSGMSMHTRLLTFAGAHPSVIDEFIRTPRPVRVWYKTAMFTPDGKRLGDTDRTENDDHAFGGPPKVAPETAYARISVIWGMSRVLVVVDQARLQGVSLGQFADYVALAGLSQIKAGAHLGDAPTILKLFDGTPQAAPDGMSDWDRAFLRSLYTTESTSKGQRAQIAHTIVRAMTH